MRAASRWFRGPDASVTDCSRSTARPTSCRCPRTATRSTDWAATCAWERTGEGAYECEIGAPWPTTGVASLHYELLPGGIRTTLSWDDGTDAAVLDGPAPVVSPTSRRRRRRRRSTSSLTSMVERGADALPTGRLIAPHPGRGTTASTSSGRPRADAGPARSRSALTSSTPWWVVYDIPDDTVCVEPQTAPPDAFGHPACSPTARGPVRCGSRSAQSSAVDTVLAEAL